MKQEFEDDQPRPPFPVLHGTARSTRRGVARLTLPTDVSDDELNTRIKSIIRELAAQGKRISMLPKHLHDGVAIDWLYDRSVEHEDLQSILRRVVPGLKDEHVMPDVQNLCPPIAGPSRNVNDNFVEPESLPVLLSDLGSRTLPSLRQTSEPAIIGSTAAPYRRCFSETVVSTGRRRRAASVERFTLTNLAPDTQADELLLSLEESGVPKNAITGIRIMAAPVGTVATVYVAAGFDAVSLERMVRGVASGQQPSQAPERPDAFINLVSDDSDVELDDGSATRATVDPHVAIQTADKLPVERKEPAPEDGSISPALSYLTLDEHRNELGNHNNAELELDAAPEEAREQTLSPYSRLLALQSSDHDSDDDLPVDNDRSGYAGVIERDEDPTERLLNDDIGAIRTFLQDSSTELHRHMQLLSDEASPSAPPSHRSLRLGGSHGGSNQRIGQRSETSDLNVKRWSQNPSSDFTFGGKGNRRGLPVHGARVQKLTLDRPVPVDSDSVSVALPKSEYAKSRRLVVPANPSLPIAAIYMRGDCQFIHRRTREHIAQFSLPSEKYRRDAVSRHVVDAISLDDSTVVIAYDRGPSQASCLTLDAEHPYLVDLPHKGHTTVIEHRHTGTSSPNPGISAIAGMPADNRHRRFLSGGRDGTVRVWKLSGSQGRSLQAESVQLPLSPGQPVRSLACRSSDGRTFVCHARHISSAHVEAPRPATPALLSAAPLQVHVHPQNPHVVLLEVDHLDYQVQIYDVRQSNFDRKPAMEFGHRVAPSMGAKHLYRRGSTSHALFARGYTDGTLCLWDYRNKDNVVKRSRARGDPIVHAVLAGDQVIAYGAYRVTFWSLSDF